jgi:hypothetical protein
VSAPDAAPAPLGTVHLWTPGDSAVLVDTSQTWPPIAPFVYVLGKSGINNFLHGDVTNIKVSGSNGPATLTIAAPNTFRLGANFSIQVDPELNGGGVAVSGNGSTLVANGSADAPIVFQSLTGAPAPGSWDGILLNYPGAAGSSITYATLDSPGAKVDVALGCAGTPVSGGAVEVYWSLTPQCQMGGPILQNLNFTNLPTGAYGILTRDEPPAAAMAYESNGNMFSGAMSVFVCAPDCH